jgi:hypothetical protein
MNRYVTGLAVVGMLLSSLTLRAQDRDDKGDQVQKVPGLELKISAKQTKYPLLLGGLTGEQFRQLLKRGEMGEAKMPNPPAVELTIELTNTSNKAIEVYTSGDPVFFTLDLKGPGAVKATLARAFTLEFRMPKATTIPPGKSYTTKLTSLTFGHRGAAEGVFWTEPGEYTLSATFTTGIKPPPARAETDESGFARVVIPSNTIKLQVEK